MGRQGGQDREAVPGGREVMEWGRSFEEEVESPRRKELVHSPVLHTHVEGETGFIRDLGLQVKD